MWTAAQDFASRSVSISFTRVKVREAEAWRIRWSRPGRVQEWERCPRRRRLDTRPSPALEGTARSVPFQQGRRNLRGRHALGPKPWSRVRLIVSLTYWNAALNSKKMGHGKK